MPSEPPDFSIESARPQEIDLDHVGVPTEYGGRTYRSRLEARWAVFFDLLHWPFEYEPFDLSGYIPDFILGFRRGDLLVEVKPAMRYEELQRNARKICLSGWHKDFMVVGAKLWWADDAHPWTSMGLLSLWDTESNDGWQPPDRASVHRCRLCRQISLHLESGEWSCIQCGASEAGRYIERLATNELEAMWVEAGNTTRWQRGSTEP
jgi:hypothetical protein